MASPEPPSQQQVIHRRGSLDHDMGCRSNSLPRKFTTLGRYPSESYLSKSDFWTGSLNRPKRRVKFEDEPPARPPPPAPMRQESLNVISNRNQHQFMANIGQQQHGFSKSQPSLARAEPATIFDHSNDPEHQVDLGNYHKDQWFEQYGKAVLDNSLQDRIEARKKKMQMYSPVQQVVMQEDMHRQHLAQSYPPYDMVRNIVLKILRAQGVPDPSEAVIDNAIKEYFENTPQPENVLA